MSGKIKILDCTLRDGAYIVDAKFGMPAIKGIIKSSQNSHIEIIECGWLKDKEHEIGTTFFHIPNDLLNYIEKKDLNCVYTAMIDWDRYNLDNLPQYDGKSIDAIRIVFPHGKYKEGIEVGKKVRDKGYKVFYQAANTLAYSDAELVELAREVNNVDVEALSIVDTFGAMFDGDLERIMSILNTNLKSGVALGFHSHNNQQLSFALSIHFVEWMKKNAHRDAVVDSSLCGMGRGAGNATTELVANYLNRMQLGYYDMDCIMDAIDTYMQPFQEKYEWGYSTPYFIAGMYCCHVNNIAYLVSNHRTNAKDMRNIIQSMSEDDRRKYDYDLLEQKYIENQSRTVDDAKTIKKYKEIFESRKILLIAPGKKANTESDLVQKYIDDNNPIVIEVNAINPKYEVDYLFLINSVRYDYAKNTYKNEFRKVDKILLSSIKTEGEEREDIVNFSSVIKTGWEHFDNAVIYCLRFLDRVGVKNVAIAGFDEFEKGYNASYADEALPTVIADSGMLNDEIANMFEDFKITNNSRIEVEFVTSSRFNL